MQQFITSIFQKNNVHIGKLRNSIGEYIASYVPPNSHIVCDNNTYAVIAHQLNKYQQLIFPSPPTADIAQVEFIRNKTANSDALIAVGSGTINDLCKLASFIDNKPYIAIATAASMNGYLSANASITVQRCKQSFQTKPPIALLADIDIINSAPKQLTKAGIGDIICRSTIQADWLLSNILLGTKYEPKYFAWLQPYENYLLNHPTEFTVEKLMHMLVLSGIAMQQHGSSAPASQSEHMVAHMMHMLFADLPYNYHGAEIAVTCIAMSKWQEQILNSKTPPQISYNPQPQNLLPSHLHELIQQQYHTKLPNIDMVNELNNIIRCNWHDIAHQIKQIIIPAKKLASAFACHAIDTSPEHIGWQQKQLEKAMHLARFSRNRFTFLDLKLGNFKQPKQC